MNKINRLICYSFLITMLLIPTAMLTSTITVKAATTNNAFLGISGYPTSTTQVQNIINTMNANDLNTYRMSFNPTWSSGPHPYRQQYVQYFLDHSNYMIIVDRNHLYPPTESSASTARNNWDEVRNSIFETLQAWPNNPRVAVELINEYISNDFYTLMQQLVNDIRSAGYTNTIVVNKWNQPWTVINDPLDNTYQGYHYYFNSWSPSGAMSQMNTALNRGIKIINTEIGADFNEYNSYTTATVDELNTFMSQSANLGIGNTVWMNENLNNLPRYQSLGIAFPTVTNPQPTSPPTQPSQWTITVTASAGGTVNQKGTYEVNTGNTFTATATSYSGYNFDKWQFDGNTYSTQTQVTIPTQNSATTHTLNAVFTPNSSPTPPPTTTPTPPTLPPPSDTILQDGFESASLNSWSDTTTTSRDRVTIDDNVPYQGDYDARFYTSGSSRGRENAYLTKDINLQTATATGNFYISNSYSSTSILANNDDRLYFIRFANDQGDIAWAGIKKQNGVDQWILYTNGASTSTAVPIDTDQYYTVSLQWDAANSIAEMYVNGEKILESNTGSYSAVTNVDMGIIYTYRVQNSMIIYGDNFSITS